MNYTNIYYNIINNRKNNPYDGYTESHHIIPRSLGGDDSKENIVDLSAREHFICHLLLTKMYKEDSIEYYKMIKAFMMMLVAKSSKQERIIHARRYAWLKEAFSKAQKNCQSGEGNSQYGKTKSEETKRKIAESVKKRYEEKGIIGNKKEIKKKKNADKRLKKIDLYKNYYILYKDKGWNEFVKLTGYDKSSSNFIQESKKFVPELVKQYKLK